MLKIMMMIEDYNMPVRESWDDSKCNDDDIDGVVIC